MFHVEHSSFWRGMAAGILAFALLSSGCASARSVRLFSPAASGMEVLGQGIYADPGLSEAQRAELIEAVAQGRERAGKFYGGLVTSPTITACATMDCYRYFGGIGTKGTSRWWVIVLAPRGRTAAVVAHEWSHSELAQRVGKTRMLFRVPQWFDEGVAVLLSEDPDYSEERWRSATDNGAKSLPLPEMWSQRAWRRATRAGHQLTYGAAGREVARWYAAVGREGFERLIEALRRGEDFPEAYQRVEAEAGRAGR
jgi:hypothetical protein